MDCDDKRVWDWILRDDKIKIIHLIRKNRLKTLISKVIAEKTGKWTSYDGKKNIETKDKKFHLEPDKCFEVFEEIESWEFQTRKTFRDHEVIEITYEDLANDREVTMKEIFRFLSLNYIKVSTIMAKQNQEKMENLLLNFEELKVELTKAGYSHFFRD